VPSIYVLVARSHAVVRERDERAVRLPELAEAS